MDFESVGINNFPQAFQEDSRYKHYPTKNIALDFA
jgi:hypothetical protein